MTYPQRGTFTQHLIMTTYPQRGTIVIVIMEASIFTEDIQVRRQHRHGHRRYNLRERPLRTSENSKQWANLFRRGRNLSGRGTGITLGLRGAGSIIRERVER